MRDLLRTGRWLGFTAAAVVAIVAFGLLSLWQWHRAEEKRLDFASVASAMAAPAQPAAAVTDPVEWQQVSATGTFDADRQFLARNRPQNGSNGFWVVTLLDSAPRDLWVVRGFLPAQGAASSATAVPDPPTGEVTVTGYARSSEAGPARPADDLPAGQVTAVNVADLDALAEATATGWYAIAASDPQLAPVPLPEATDSRNLSYAGQWLLFAAITVGGWYYFLRREARDTAAAVAAESHPVEVA